MKCLLTGAAGFTGGHLARALMARGHKIRALVRPGSAFQSLAEDGIEIFQGDIGSKNDVASAAAACDQIYHLAAVFRTAGHADSYYRQINVEGTLNVLDAARVHGCERVIHCSTAGVHGHIDRPPANEEYPFRPHDIYQESKLEAELAVAAAGKRGQPVTIVRPGAIYGEGDLRFLKLFRLISRRRFAMIGSGETRLHMVHIDDLVDGFIRCGARQEALGQAFIVAGREAPTLNEFAAMAAEAVGAPAPKLRIPVWPVHAAGWLCERIFIPLGLEPPLHRRRASFFTNHREFDISKARTLLGYEPKVPVREGIRRTAMWYYENGFLEPLGDMRPKTATSRLRA